MSAAMDEQILSAKRQRVSDNNNTSTGGQHVTPGAGRDSFSRFTRELSATIIGYLAVDDRFQCECLSRQWQSWVYQSQHRLVIDDSLAVDTPGGQSSAIDTRKVETIVRKCPNVSHVEYYCPQQSPGEHFTDQLLDLFIKYCVHLTSIHVVLNPSVSTETVDMFFAKFGKQLLSVQYDWCPDGAHLNDCVMKNIRQRCPNLQELVIDGQSLPAGQPPPVATNRGNLADQLALVTADGGDQQLFQRLHKFSFDYRPTGPSDAALADSFGRFVDKYADTMRTVRVKIADTSDEPAIEQLMAGLARMPALIDLQITYNTINNPISAAIVAGLTRFGADGRRPPALRRLSLHLNYDFAVILRTINDTFAGLTRLETRGFVYDKEDVPLTSRALARCRRLTHVTIDYFSQMGAEFFADIGHCLPRLESLWLSEVHVTDRELSALAACRRLRTVEFDGNQRTSRAGVQQFVRQLPKVREVLINDRKYV